MSDPFLSPITSRAARAILQWTLGDLAGVAHLSKTVVHRFETGGAISDEQATKIAQAFSNHGVELLGDGKPGARLMKA